VSKNRGSISQEAPLDAATAFNGADGPAIALGNQPHVAQKTAPITKSASGRLTLIDALRGFAAMAVVVYHIYGNIAEDIQQWVPRIVHGLIQFGFIGVPVFFVVSGFVISRTTDDDKVTPAYAGRFMLRRAIRLDPPYWCAIALAISLIAIKNRLFPEFGQPLPPWTDVMAHLFYFQDLLHRHPISVVFWTLCLEIQLYITYIMLRCGCDNYSPLTRLQADRILVGMCLGLGVLSLLVSSKMLSLHIEGLFIAYWHQFLLGVLANWAASGRVSIRLFAVCIAATITMQTLTTINPNSMAALVVASFIVLASRMGHLHDWLKGAVIQYLGRISYSLYLLHPEIGWSTVSLGKYLLGPVLSPIGAIVLFIAGIGTSVVAAHLLNTLIERPAMKLAKRITH
jgi:peptidoglycan/LPS O-acetylase OafA/YrhL